MEVNKRYVIREGYSGTVFEQSDDLGEVLDIYKGYFDPSIDKSELDGWQNDLDEELTKLKQWGIDTEVNGVDLDEFLENCWETMEYYIEVVDIQFENDIKDKYNYYSNVKRMLKDFYGENAKITDKNVWDGKEAEVTESRYVVKNGLSGTVYYETDDLADAYKELTLNVYHGKHDRRAEYELAVDDILNKLDWFGEEFDKSGSLNDYLTEHPTVANGLQELGIFIHFRNLNAYEKPIVIKEININHKHVLSEEQVGCGIEPKKVDDFLAEHNIGKNELVNFQLSDFIDEYYSGKEEHRDFRGRLYYRPVEYDYMCVEDTKEHESITNTKGEDYLSLTSEMLNDYFGDLPIITKKELQDRINTIENNVDGFNTKIIDRKLKEMEEKAKLEIKYEEEQKKETKRKSKGMSL